MNTNPFANIDLLYDYPVHITIDSDVTNICLNTVDFDIDSNVIGNIEKCITFAIQSNTESSRTKDNTPSLPLNDAHLEGFFMPIPQP